MYDEMGLGKQGEAAWGCEEWACAVGWLSAAAEMAIVLLEETEAIERMKFSFCSFHQNIVKKQQRLLMVSQCSLSSQNF